MNPVIVALDVESQAAPQLIKNLAAEIDIFKIGSRLFTECGPQTVQWADAAQRKVFLDLKFHDIPNTVASACRMAANLGVWGLTIHASGGFAMMQAAAQSLVEESQKIGRPKPLVFGVTVLTSLTAPEIAEVGVNVSPREQVLRLAALAQKAGLDGVVCSGEEIAALRQACGEKFLLVVPGIRPAQSDKGDQSRVATPASAMSLGANYLVVGRPIVESKDPLEAARKIVSEVRASL